MNFKRSTHLICNACLQYKSQIELSMLSILILSIYQICNFNIKLIKYLSP